MASNQQPATFYLVTHYEYGLTYGHPVWKWGITTKATAKQRSSTYVDTHRWVEIRSMAVGRRLEKLMGCLMVNVLGDRDHRDMYDESVPEAFPFEVLLEMFDWTVENVDQAGVWSDATDGLHGAACPGSEDEETPEIALLFRVKHADALRRLPKPRAAEPMWA